MSQSFVNAPLFWKVGKGGLLVPGRVVAAGRFQSEPIKREVRKARKENRLIDLTYGEACVWVIFTDSYHLVLASEPMPVNSIDDGDDPDTDPRADIPFPNYHQFGGGRR